MLLGISFTLALICSGLIIIQNLKFKKMESTIRNNNKKIRLMKSKLNENQIIITDIKSNFDKINNHLEKLQNIVNQKTWSK